MTSALIWAMTISAGVAFSACGGDDDGPAPGPSKPEGGSATITVSATNIETNHVAQDIPVQINVSADWSIASNADWITVSTRGGLANQNYDVLLKLTENRDADARTGTVTVKSGKSTQEITVKQNPTTVLSLDSPKLTASAAASTLSVVVTSNADWTCSSSAAWCKPQPTRGQKGETTVNIEVAENTTKADREATVTFDCGGNETTLTVSQLSDAINIPAGYKLVWNDEFNGGPNLGSDWTYEVQKQGWVNNELQNYVKNKVDGKLTVEVKNGLLNITAFKGSDGKVYSGRVYAKVNTGWTYGYFEARIKLPKGKGTWPAYWMMPCNVDWNKNPWPMCGEIDIMEEVGYRPNYVSSSIHTQNYNHTINTQKTHEMFCAGAEGEYHIYALEWTADGITTYVDGKTQLKVTKAQLGSDHNSWPFHYAFYPILNLAWGGDWGGQQGVDESALPATMQVDYLRIFQK